MNPFLVQVTFYNWNEPVAVQVTTVFAESRDDAEVKGYEVADDMVEQGDWDYGHNKIEVEVLDN